MPALRCVLLTFKTMNNINYQQIFLNGSDLTTLIAILIYLIRFRKVYPPEHIIGVLLIISGLSDLISYFFVQAKIKTALVFNIFFIIQFCLVSWYHAKNQFRIRSAVIGTGVVNYIIAILLVTIFLEQFNENQSSMWAIGALILIAYGIIYFRALFKNYPTDDLMKYPSFWVNTALLFYFSFSLPFFVYGNHILTKLSPDISRLVWSFFSLNNIIKNVLLTIGLLYSHRNISKS
jgi:hypothetical protein